MTLTVSRTEEPVTAPVGERVFGPNGTLARALPGYEPRRPQQEMADLVEQMLRDGGQALIEGATGTGKSFAYLVPAVESGQRVIVSTESIQLQEQLVRKDLPFLEKALGRKIRFAIAKGRSNYFCERNTVAIVQDEESRLAMADERTNLELARSLLAEFGGEWDGNKSTLQLTVPDAAWSDFAGDDSCTGSRCPHARDCAYLKAKAEFEQADVVVTNHHYYLLHHYVKERTDSAVSLLPEHRIWIADEAHTLADIAQNVFGLEMRQGQPRRFVSKLLRQLKALKLELDVDWNTPQIEAAADRFFDVFRGALKDEQLFEEFPPTILAEAAERSERLISTLQPIRTGLHRLGATIDPGDIETRRALNMLKMGADGLIDGLRSFFEAPTIYCAACAGTGTDEETDDVCEGCDGKGKLPDPDPPVTYAEVTIRSRDRDGKKHVTLHRKPAETQRIFKRLYGEMATAVFTSATLASSGSFGPIAEELGINPFESETLQAKSPFDYPAQVRGYFPKTVPDGKSPDYHDRLADEVLRIVEWTEGRAFILFTAFRDLRAVHERLLYRCPYPLLVQGDMSKDLLIEQFRAEPSVLLGVRTFWTGVDIPGQALSCVVIVKFPFPQPEAPLVKARCQRIEARRQRSFDVYSLPRAIRDIQQGFGRLIRSRADRGLFAILDSRWHSANYARKIERSLPAFPSSTELPEDWSLNDGVCTTLEAPVEGGADDPDPFADCDELQPGAIGPDLQPEPRLLPELRPVVEPDGAGQRRLPELGIDPPGGRDRAGDREPQAASATAAGGVGRANLGDASRAAAAPEGPVSGYPGDPGSSPPGDAADAPARWLYLQAWVRACYCTGGPGTGSIRRGVSDAETIEGRSLWATLFGQWQKLRIREQWLIENAGCEGWEMLDEKALRSARRFGELRQGVAEWAGVGVDLICELLAEATSPPGEDE